MAADTFLAYLSLVQVVPSRAGQIVAMHRHDHGYIHAPACNQNRRRKHRIDTVHMNDIWSVDLDETTHFAVRINVVDAAPERIHSLQDRVLEDPARFHHQSCFVPVLREYSQRGIDYGRFPAKSASLLVIDLQYLHGFSYSLPAVAQTVCNRGNGLVRNSVL